MSVRERTRGVSSWIPDSDLWIAAGRVVHYTTKLPSVDDQGRLWPRGTSCMALRAPNGDLGLVRFVGPQGGEDAMIVMWLHRDTGLAGAEPGVVDPMLMNLETATRAADEAVRQALAPYRETEERVQRLARQGLAPHEVVDADPPEEWGDEGRTIERDVSKWVNVSGVPLFPTREEVEALRGAPFHASEAPEEDDGNPPPWDVPDDEELPGEPAGSRLLDDDEASDSEDGSEEEAEDDSEEDSEEEGEETGGGHF
jgi:hypothetical protein